ncbi:MAG TPA: hypothetical protein VK945_05165 [Planococcus sp. (in: firmicutes)]|nr:hypothetical protein [Planococcus sp. (in: firmicutes)]
MHKFFLSLLSGTAIGLMFLSFLMQFPHIQRAVLNQAGINQMTVRGLDFQFVYNATLIITASTIFIFLVWTIIEKGLDKHHYSN